MSFAEFPLFTAGPLYRLQEKFGLVREGNRGLGLIALYSVCIAWAPMALLAAAEGLAIGPTRFSSFLMDFAVNVRFLIALPVFLLGETTCERQLQTVVQQFQNAGLVLEKARAQFQDVVQDIVQLSSSGRVAAGLLVLAFLHSLIAFMFIIHYPEMTWRIGGGDGRHVLTLAGGWYFLVSFPMYSFVLLRWVWRLGLWWRLLWRISRLELDLSPAHRDGAAGLGFLSESLLAFGGFAFAVTATTAGEVADYVVYDGASPLQYEWEVGGLLAALLIMIAGPLMLFVRQLYEAKDSAVFQYGALVSRQIQQLEREVGAKLFIRRPQRIELTDRGTLLLEEARRLGAIADEFLETAQSVKRRSTGVVRIGMSWGLWSGLNRVRTRYSKDHPDVEITIDDPQAYAKPWHATVPVHLLPDSDLIETYCENEKDVSHMR